MHHRVPLATGVLGRRWGFDESRINDGAKLYQQTTLSQHRVDLFKEPVSQLMFFEQVTKVQDGGLVGNTAASQRQAGKLTKRLHFVEHLLHGQFTQRKPLLHKVNPKHRLKRIRRTTDFGFGGRPAQSRQSVLPKAQGHPSRPGICRAAFAYAGHRTQHQKSSIGA